MAHSQSVPKGDRDEAPIGQCQYCKAVTERFVRCTVAKPDGTRMVKFDMCHQCWNRVEILLGIGANRG